MFYSTPAFYDLVEPIIDCSDAHNVAYKNDASRKERMRLEMIYGVILEKCYGVSSFFNTEIVHSLADDKTGLTHFYRIRMDARFIDVHASRELPEINKEALKNRFVAYDADVLPLLQRILPVGMFLFEGFGITSITDVTTAYAIENIKNEILNVYESDKDQCFRNISISLKAIAGSSHIDFGIFPVLTVNGHTVFDKNFCANSMLLRTGESPAIAESIYLRLSRRFTSEPKVIFYKEITSADERRHDYLARFTSAGIKSYALLPVYFNKRLCGMLELYSKVPGVLKELTVVAIEPAMSLLSQFMNNSVHQFNDHIDCVIKEKFTSVQPAVQWKFNEVAWHYLRDKHDKSPNTEPEDIGFENVFPLYGAVDLRNSTIERNAALQKDLVVQFGLLIDMLGQLKEISGFGLIDAKIFSANEWLERISAAGDFHEEIMVNDFLENNIHPFISDLAKGHPSWQAVVQKYYACVSGAGAIVNKHRYALETSMNTVISAVNFYLESMKSEIQHAYPSYFEKFRTDGVEYDIYIGQSIAPDKSFSEIYLKNLRLLQLTSMAAITKYTESLKAELVVPIDTTQLIFVHSNPIDIRFRRDEKRFDVEGAYNIRYHIVKKRIDKIHIRNTDERLTQPGKIAIVYFTSQEADEYRGFIRYLQGQHILEDGIEDIELEEMQGVSGLRALRVSVKYDRSPG